MLKLSTKLVLYNFLSKLFFAFVFIVILPYAVDRINTAQTDRELVEKKEKIMDLISRSGIDSYMLTDSSDAFSSYNIFKEEFLRIEKDRNGTELYSIENTRREIENETIDFRLLKYSFDYDGNSYLLEIGKSIPRILNGQKNIKQGILIFLVAIFVLMLFSDLVYTRRTLYPLNLIINKLKNTSSPSLFDRSQVKTGTRDFIALDSTIRELMNRLDAMLAMEKDITVNISHELLTPVSVLRSRLENLLIQDSLDNQAREKIEDSLRILYRLKTLVNSLLMISRIESRQYLKEDSFRAEDVLNEVIEELEPIATDKNISIQNILSPEHFITGANQSLIFSMFYNVLNNAIQNTDPEGQIIVKDELAEGSYRVSFSDNGKGMSEEQVKNIFLRFRNKKTNNETGRNGIGLLITKSIADFHQINLKVDSVPGNGTRIIFIFPENS